MPNSDLPGTRGLTADPPAHSSKAGLDLTAAAPSKARPISVTTPRSWDVSSLPPPGGTFNRLWAVHGQPWWRKRALKGEQYGLYWSKREEEEEGAGSGGPGVLSSENNRRIL